MMHAEETAMTEKINTFPKRCLALYSGGLDSIIAIKLLADQGIEIEPLYFATPFFGFQALLDPEPFTKAHLTRFGIRIRIIDYTDEFIKILADPAHGYGKHFNPCIDCKIGMLKMAKDMLAPLQASFVVTGEVLGQRPMSQRRDAMNIIERDAGLKDLLLRPLTAQHMKPTLPERSGIVNRAALPAIAGRGRKVQEEIAHAHGIFDIPNPAGGCLLTYAQIAHKVRRTFERFAPALPSRYDLILDVVGRMFMLDAATVCVVSRNEQETDLMAKLNYPGNTFLKLTGIPGPLCIIRGEHACDNLEKAAGICLRYSKARGQSGLHALWGVSPQNLDQTVRAPIMDEDEIRAYLIEETPSPHT